MAIPSRPPNRAIPQTYGDINNTDLNEIFRRLSELSSSIEGRRGPIILKDSVEILTNLRKSLIKFRGKGDRATGSISFEGETGSSMYIGKGCYQTDTGAWIATENAPLILELNANSVSPRMYRNVGVAIGAEFTPNPIGYIAVGDEDGLVSPGTLLHGGLLGLGADDHTQYLKEKLSGGLASEIPVHAHSSGAEAGQLDHGTAHTSASLLDNDHTLYQRKHGFDLSSSGAPLQTITYDKTTKVVTVTPVGATFTFWIDGVQFIKTGAQTAPAHGATTGKYFIYYDATGTLQTGAVEVAWSIRDRTVTPVALVYWNNTLSDGICFYECHTADRILEHHYRDHFALGTQYISGGALTGYTPLLDTDAGVTYAIGSGVISDEDIRFEFGNIPDGGPYVIFYRTGGTGVWAWDATPTFPFLSGATYPSWNNPNGGGAGVWGMTETSGAALGTYVNYFVCATSAVTPAAASGFLIPGQASHATLAAAQGEYLTTLALGTLPFEEVRGIWRVTLRARGTYGGSHQCVIQEITKITSQSVTVSGGSPGITDHGALTGLLDDDHTQYQLRSEQGVAAGYPTLDASAVVEEPVKLYRQGLDAAVPALAEGELYWATDTDTLYVGT